MNETTELPQADQAEPSPSRTLFEKLSDLRRSLADRKVAGVAGGLARHFGIDPTLVRVLFVVLAIFGGAGLLAYVALWLFVPSDDGAAVISTPDEARRVVLVGAGVIALCIAASWGAAWALVPVGIVALVAFLMISADRTGTPATSAPAATFATDGPPAAAANYGPPAAAANYGQPAAAVNDGPPPANFAQPIADPEPRRTGPVLLWPTLGLIAIGVGMLGLYDLDQYVAPGAYPALALGLTGVMTAIGSVFGRPGGLILLGTLSLVAMLIATSAGDGYGDERASYTPVSAAAVRSDYHLGTGELRLDLTDVDNLDALDGRDLSASVDIGRLEVIVPDGLNVELEASNHWVGNISLPDNQNQGGFGSDIATLLPAETDSKAPTIDLELDVNIGEIAVVRR